jgi:hypothetical protein
MQINQIRSMKEVWDEGICHYSNERMRADTKNAVDPAKVLLLFHGNGLLPPYLLFTVIITSNKVI